MQRHLQTLFLATFALLLLGSPFRAQATLIDRGNGLIYDDVLDITWLQDANFGGRFDHPHALDFAANLVFQGFDDWRLPSMDVNGDDTVVDCYLASELACRDNELGYMYHQNLGGTGNNLSGNQGLFQDIQLAHWSSTLFAPDPFNVFAFVFIIGYQGFGDPYPSFGAWAVRNGDVIDAPLPSSVALMVVGLLGLVASRKRFGRLS